MYLIKSELQLRGGIEDKSQQKRVTPHQNHLYETVLMVGHRICFFMEKCG